MSNLNQQITLPDGRRLGYDERGPSDGKPLFYFHGSPSSRVESNLYVNDELLQSLNIRLIVVDRPGIGLSDFQKDRLLLDWPQDVLALAEHLKIERFPVLAYSLGGPYGAACAYTMLVAPFGSFSGYAGAGALAFIMIPIILIGSQESLRLVPEVLREGALALGVARWRVILQVVVPAARRALLTGMVLAIARALGETAPLLFTAFGNRFMEVDPGKPMAAIPLVIYRYATGPYDEWHRQAWAAAFMLVVIVLMSSVLTRFLLRSRYDT